MKYGPYAIQGDSHPRPIPLGNFGPQCFHHVFNSLPFDIAAGRILEYFLPRVFLATVHCYLILLHDIISVNLQLRAFDRKLAQFWRLEMESLPRFSVATRPPISTGIHVAGIH